MMDASPAVSAPPTCDGVLDVMSQCLSDTSVPQCPTMHLFLSSCRQYCNIVHTAMSLISPQPVPTDRRSWLSSVNGDVNDVNDSMKCITSLWTTSIVQSPSCPCDGVT